VRLEVFLNEHSLCVFVINKLQPNPQDWAVGQKLGQVILNLGYLSFSIVDTCPRYVIIMTNYNYLRNYNYLKTSNSYFAPKNEAIPACITVGTPVQLSKNHFYMHDIQ